MKQILSATLLLSAVVGIGAQTPPGFSNYIVGFMTRAAGQLPAGATSAELQKGHIANLNKMWEDGLLVASGPIGDTGDLRGVVIFRGDARAVVERRLADDPLVNAGFLKISLSRWIAPAGIGAEYKKWAAANPGAPDKMRTYQLVLLKPVPGATPLNGKEQGAHLAQMDAMVKANKLAVAGPIPDTGPIAGIFVFTTDATEADALAASDPLVKAGKMTSERHAWMVAEGVLPNGFKVQRP